MSRTHLALLLPFFAAFTGCAETRSIAPASAHAKTEPKIIIRIETDDWMPKAEAAEVDPAAITPARTVGDFVVYRFSGAFRKHPVTLTQKVIGREGDLVVLDVVLDDGSSKQQLHVRMSDAVATRGEVQAVMNVVDGKEAPIANAAYDTLLAKTMLVADANEAMLGAEEVEVEVGGVKLASTRTTYKVKVGGKDATMKTTASEAFAWGDVAGEIVAKDGKLLYKAEVVEAGHADEPKAVAHNPDDEL